MKCDAVRGLLEDFRDGELDPALAARVWDHAASCPGCGAELAALEREEKAYLDYRRTVDGELNTGSWMWQRIERELHAGPARESWGARLWSFLPGAPRMRQAVFAAALVVVSICGTLLTMHWYRMRDDAGAAQVAPEERGTTLQDALRSIQRAEQEYLEAIRVLNGIVDQRKPTLDPALVAELNANLKAIDESIAATRRAYLAHPTDPELAIYMLAAYSRKVELLQEIAS